MSNWRGSIWLKCLTGIFLSGCLQSIASAGVINDVRVWSEKNATRVVFDTTNSVTYQAFTLSAPPRLVVDLPSVALANIGTSLANAMRDNRLIEGIRTGAHEQGSRLVLDLREPVSIASHFSLGPTADQPYRLVLDLDHDVRDTNDRVTRTTSAPQTDIPDSNPAPAVKPVVIAIDAGHGGRDPGAIGPAGTLEKEVVLAISQKLHTLINAEPGYKAILTRPNDTYIGLRQRTEIARQHSADFFISIHADAAQRRTAAGASIYGLSTQGASSATARWLANSENRAVVSDDHALIALADHDVFTRNTLIDLSMGQSLNNALAAGDLLVGSLSHITTLHKPKVELANFAVLRSPDMPSLLVETGFISNPEEERRLNSDTHQTALAQSLLKGLTHYFEQTPPSDHWHKTYVQVGASLSSTDINKNKSDTSINLSPYATQAGETLADIAQHFGIDIVELLARIDLEDLEIAQGQVMTVRLPAGATN